MKICSVEGCKTPAKTRGWCNKHYLRFRRTGTADSPDWSPICSVEGCDRDLVSTGQRVGKTSKGLCQKHYQRLRLTGTTDLVKSLGCSVDGCEREHEARGFCAKHYRRWSTYGDPDFVLPRGQRLDPSWIPTYIAIHARLRRERGPATDHACADCGNPADHWSYNKADPLELTEVTAAGWVLPYSLDPANYDPRCRSCHTTHDCSGRTHCRRGHELTPKNTYITPGTGARTCRTCREASKGAWRQSQKAKS